jgi:hypothetical protein
MRIKTEEKEKEKRAFMARATSHKSRVKRVDG